MLYKYCKRFDNKKSIRRKVLKFDFVVGIGFSAVFTKFVQSKFLFNIYRVFSGSIIFVLTGRTLEYK